MADHTFARRPLLESASDVMFLGAINAIVFAVVGVWGVGRGASLLVAGPPPQATPTDSIGVLGRLPFHWTDPRLAWPAADQDRLPGAAGVYGTALVLAVLLSVVAWQLVRQYGLHRQQRGMASAAQLRKVFSYRAVLSRGERLRPGLAKPGPEDVSVLLGEVRGIPQRLPIDNSVLLLAAPRQGKTSQVIIPWLAQWRGPALVTSVRNDVAFATMTIRAQVGPVAVLDFSDTAWPHRLSWSPTIDCERFDIARERADVMVSVGKPETGPSDSTNAGFFGLTATNLLAAWLHAAALTGRSMDEVLRWALDETDDEPIRLLADHPDAAPGVAQMINSIYRSPLETRSNMWTTVMTAVAPLLSDAARRVFCPPAGASIDLEQFLRARGTIYLLVSEKQAGSLAPLISAFVEELTTVAKRLADNSPAERLDPPLALILDEVANVAPLPQLPALMSYAGGSGIFVVAVLQSLAQARHRWGRDGADMLWGAATTKIALGGLSGDELTEFSKLAGTYRETLHTSSRGHHGYTTSTSLHDRKTLSPDKVRTLDEADRQALIVHASTPAFVTRLLRHYESRQARQYLTSVIETRTAVGLPVKEGASRD